MIKPRRLFRQCESFARAAGKQVLLRVWRRKFRQEITQYLSPYSLHLGCGDHRLHGWVNIDLVKHAGADIQWNVCEEFPLPSASCRSIFHEHLLEHFSVEEGLRMLKECHRLLMPGGVLRVAMPSLEVMLASCSDGSWKEKKSVHMPPVETRAEYLNIYFRRWGHKWIYDREELHRRLREAGFRTIRDCQRSVSTVPVLNDLECRPDSLLICECVREVD
jgi:predicted SAM-dependent methyltransferase